MSNSVLELSAAEKTNKFLVYFENEMYDTPSCVVMCE